MRNDRLVPGTILVIIGALFLLNNFNYIDFSWEVLLSLWPIILIIAGVNLVFAHNRSHWATILKLAVLFAGMGILIWGGVTHRYHNFWFTRDYSYNYDDRGGMANNFAEPYKPQVQSARLNISGGAARYTLNDTTGQLFVASTDQRNGNNYSLKTLLDSGTEVLNFEMGGDQNNHGHFFFWGGGRSNRATIKLNSNPVWDIDVSTGASKLDFDLSPFKIKSLKIEGGVATFNVKMGEPLAITNIDVQTGVSNVRVKIPQTAACHITTDTGLSSKNFDGFNKLSDTEYETPGFAGAINKMNISLSGGVSHFRVERY